MNKVLFVCSANKQRSKTAEDLFTLLYPDITFLSAGTNVKVCMKEGTTPLSEDLLEWADMVYVMENKHYKLINNLTNNKYLKKIIILNIGDIYKYYDKELINILKKKITF